MDKFSMLCSRDAYLPQAAKILAITQETANIFTLHFSFIEQEVGENFSFAPGQFNMVYLYGVGEVAISIGADLAAKNIFTHTIRAVGRVTKALQKLKVGDWIGVRGPYGRGWPLAAAVNKDVIIISGGLGCAPTIAAIQYLIQQRTQYGKIKILQGMKHSNDFIFRQEYANWSKLPGVEIYLSASTVEKNWSGQSGLVTDMLKNLALDPEKSLAMICGPEIMMKLAAESLIQRGMPEEQIYLSMERNMECGVGQCGHCQYGGLFVCKDGPVFSYPQIKALFSIDGF